MSLWTHRTVGTAARNGTNAHTITFSTFGDAPFTPIDGRFLLMLVSASVTHTWPGGWTERLQPLASSELSVATTTVSSTTSVTITHNASNYPLNVAVYEFEAGTTWVAGTSATNQNTGSTPSVTGLPGTEVTVFYGVTGSRTATSSTTVPDPNITWGSPAIGDVDQDTVFASTEGNYLGIAYADGITATSSSVTVSYNASAFGGAKQERVTFALAPASLPGSPPVVDAGADITANLGDTVTRTASATNSPTSWAWTISSGPAGVGSTIGTAAALSWAPSATGTYVLQAAATNVAGTGTDTVTVTVSTPPTPVVNVGADIAVPFGTVITRTASGTNNPTTWAWSTTTGPSSPQSIGSTVTLSWSPPAVGSYTVQAAGTNAGGTGTDSLTVTVTPPLGRSFGRRFFAAA